MNQRNRRVWTGWMMVGAVACGSDDRRTGDTPDASVQEAGFEPSTGGASADAAVTGGRPAGGSGGTGAAGSSGSAGTGTGGMGPDGSPGSGGAPSMDGAVPPTPGGCAELAAALPERSGRTLRVSPADDGNVRLDGQLMSLRDAVSSAEPGDTVLLEDGTYSFAEAGPDDYTGVYLARPDVTLRSASGDRSAVVLDSAYADHGGESAPVTIAANGIVVADLTVRASVFHLIHLWEDADDAIVHNVRLIDGGQQFLKSSPASGTVDNVEVSCSEFVMTNAGRDNVWGYGPSDGSTTCYTGGIDTHESRNWRVLYNRFEGIYCDAEGVARPAHGKRADLRQGTYTGGLSEHAIHMWDSAEGSAHTIEGNVILNCARGIGVGLSAEVYGSVIRNNMVWSNHPGSREHDVGIIVERGHDMAIENNTVFLADPDSYQNAIEYRWDTTANLTIRNNLTNRLVQARNGAGATLSQNVTEADASMFRDAATGDLHLASCDLTSVIGQGENIAAIATDIDGDARDGTNDVGADQCLP